MNSQASALNLLAQATSSDDAVEGDPFASVKKMIKGLIENLQAANNKDQGQQKYCDEQMAKNRREQQTAKNDLDMKKAEARNHQHGITRFTDSVKFFADEIARMKIELQQA